MIELKGHFYLPENKEVIELHIPGIVKISEKGKIYLELYSSVSQKKYLFSHLDEEKNITIWGVLENNKKISLFRCFVSSSRKSLGSAISNICYFANYAIQGIHENSIEARCINNINSEIESLDVWINLDGGTITPYNEETKSFVYNYTLPKAIRCDISEDLKMILGFSVNINYKKYGIDVTQNSLLELHSKSDMPIEELKNLIFQFVWFLTINSNMRIGYKSITLSNSRDVIQYSDIDIQRNYYKLFMRRDDYPYSLKVTRDKFLISFEDIEDEIQDIFRKWFNLFKKGFNHIIELVVEKIQQKDIFTIQYFLSLTQALEGFHRLKNPKKNTFLKRLTDIFFSNRNSILKNTSDEDLNALLKEIKDLRNKYTHIEVFTEAGVNNKIIYFTAILLHQLRISLLKEIGIKEQLINWKKIENDLYIYRNLRK